MGDGQLIELVKHYEVIYNVKCDDYRDTSLRNAAWEDIAKQHGKTVNECREDWNKLRNCYNNAIKRRKKKKGAPGKRMPPWRFEEKMSFLKPYLQGTYITGDLDEDVYESLPSPGSSPSPKCNFLSETFESPKSDRSVTPPQSSSASYKRKASPVIDYEHVANMMSIMKQSQEMAQPNEELDEIDYFFLSMSKSVKKLPRLDQIRIKMNLHEAVSKAELKQIEAEESD